MSTPRCSARALGVLVSDGISPETGEHGDVFLLTNRSSRRCHVSGYPRVVFSALGRRLAFHQVEGRRAPYVSKGRPVPVLIAPGRQVYFAVLKYRCDAGGVATATTVSVTLPGSSHSLTQRVRGERGVGAIEYCRRWAGSSSVDPGNYIGVSPIVALPVAAFEHVT